MKYFALALLVSLFACHDPEPSPAARSADSVEAEERRAQSVAAVAALELPTNPGLPLTLSADGVLPRGVDEMADRAIALMLVAIKGERGHDESLTDYLERFGARAAFTPEEAAFIEDSAPEMQTRIDFSWRFECLHVLLWSLGYLNELDSPGQTADLGGEVTLVVDADESFGQGAVLRSPSEFLDQADYYSHLLWAGRALRSAGEELPASVNYSVVYERLRALRWLVGHQGQSWDDVTLETPG